jgi:hypothetical protein
LEVPKETREKRPADQVDYFEYAEDDLQLSACSYCENKLPGGAVCKAFSDGIPDEILLMGNDHMEPIEGDNGIQFEPKPGWEIPKRLQKE